MDTWLYMAQSHGITIYSTAQVKEPKNSLFRISAFRELAKNTRNQTE